jgi:DNA polymerase-3 subunit gamma/tau
MVSKEKLLTLMDRAAEVEGSMRWAPNKRLCFEVGIIKAIQQLGEASLSDVIAVLGNAIGHTPVGTIPNLPIPSSSLAPSPPAPPKPDAPEEAMPLPPPVSSPELDETDLSDSSDLAGAPTPVEPTPEPPPEPVILLQGAELWAAALQEMEQSLPLSHGWAFQGVYQATEGDKFILGFHPDDEPAAESIERPTVRREIESILQKRSGQALKLVTRITAEVIPPEMELPEPEPPPKSEKQTAEDNSAAAAKDAEAQQAAVEAEFRNDPMIREALDIFDGKIVAGKVGIVSS